MAESVRKLPTECYEDIADVANKEYICSDGCGLISQDIAKFLLESMDFRFRNQTYLPLAFQTRYRGYDGVSMIDSTIKHKTKINFRESMRTFNRGDDLSFSVINYAKV